MARNLIAMSADDVAAGGDLPLVYMNVIDYKQLESPEQKLAYAKLFEGLAVVAKEQDFVLLTGESAGL
jgi:phosphoribosylaminoimidazole (AIR) synthetase